MVTGVADEFLNEPIIKSSPVPSGEGQVGRRSGLRPSPTLKSTEAYRVKGSVEVETWGLTCPYELSMEGVTCEEALMM